MLNSSNESEYVNSYWGENSNRVKISVADAIYIIQRAFRKYLKRRKEIMDQNYSAQKITLVQTTIRQWLFKNQVRHMLAEKRRKDEKFHEFCVMMCNKKRIKMYSKKYNTLNDREFQINPNTFALICTKSKLHTISKDLRLLNAMTCSQFQEERSFTLHFEGNFEFQLFAGIDDFPKLTEGFEHLIKLLLCPGGLYLDKNGIPTRSSTSIIKNAINYK